MVGAVLTPEWRLFREPRICDCEQHGFIGLTKGYVTIFDPEDLPRLAERLWSANVQGRSIYARAAQRRPEGGWRQVKMHRYIVQTDAPYIDHVNGDTLDNRKTNLRPCTPSQSAKNVRKKSATAPYKGVFFIKGKHRATIVANGRTYRLGGFHSAEDAARAYDEAALRLHGEFARTNEMLGLLPAQEPS